jgi:hypothetical protein
MPQKSQPERKNQGSTEESKGEKKSVVLNAFIIGFMIGIVLYSIFQNTWGLVTLIPLYFIYRMTRKPAEAESK